MQLIGKLLIVNLIYAPTYHGVKVALGAGVGGIVTIGHVVTSTYCNESK